MEYGADALYLAGKEFGMRSQAGNFSLEELKTILEIAHGRGVKIYVTVNVYPRNEEIDLLPPYLQKLEELQVDGIILADLGVYKLARQYAPRRRLHLSTQANTVNYRAAQFWQELGLSRLIMARELSGAELERICRETEIEIEVFVHGGPCVLPIPGAAS